MSETQSRLGFEPADRLTPARPADNPLVDCARQVIPRLTAFDGDIGIRLEEDIDDSLYDIQLMREGLQAIDDLIALLMSTRNRVAERIKKTMDAKIEAKVFTDGTFEIFPLTRSTKRSVNKPLLMERAPDQYRILLDARIDDLRETYTPTIKEIEALLKKRADEFLIPGTTEVIGYDFRIVGMQGVQV